MILEIKLNVCVHIVCGYVCVRVCVRRWRWGAVQEKGETCSANERVNGIIREGGERVCTEALWGDEYSCAERQRKMHTKTTSTNQH